MHPSHYVLHFPPASSWWDHFYLTKIVMSSDLQLLSLLAINRATPYSAATICCLDFQHTWFVLVWEFVGKFGRKPSVHRPGPSLQASWYAAPHKWKLFRLKPKCTRPKWGGPWGWRANLPNLGDTQRRAGVCSKCQSSKRSTRLDRRPGT